MKPLWPLLGLLVGTLVHAPRAHARSDEDSAIPPLRFYAFGMAVVPNDEDSGAAGIGTSAFLLAGPFEVGATLSGETTLIGYHRAGLGAHAGLRIPIARIELEAAATLGGAWLRMDGNFLTDDPGASGSIGFVGGRGGVDYVIYRSARGRSHGSLALVVSYEHDLEPYTVEYTYVEESSWSWGSSETEPTVETSHKRIGMNRAALILAFGIGFD